MPFLSSALRNFRSFSPLDSDRQVEPAAHKIPPFPCPVCDQTMIVRSVALATKFGLTDARIHALKCESCGMMADRVYHPSIGYDRALVV